ncbi:hypothetical protein NHX12_019856 [Muraenolepis orangiensis]|uniref:Tudor domain-containing protein n=1 Tax=Muraenolepis orangiensis TaxID=630683 RepID=A0A9Q0EXH1_9TELE|nr:hypothetical protein NHX12_019856 [Muraenolepis orangiensis]
MQLHYDGGCVPGPGPPWTGGSPCATRGPDGTWRRSLLTRDVAGGTISVEVLHVDYGETLLIPMAEIRHLHADFLRIPVMTYHCAIRGMCATPLSEDQIDDMIWLLYHAVVARFDHYDAVKNIYDVTLFDVEGYCINLYLTEKPVVLSDSGQDSSGDCTAPLGTDKRSGTTVDQRKDRSPRSENPANGRTDDDKCVDRKGRPNRSPIGRENVNPVTQNGHASLPSTTKFSTPEIPVDHCQMQKLTITERNMRTPQRHEVCNGNGLQVKDVQKMSGPSAPVDAGQSVNRSVEPRKTFRNATLADLPSRFLERGLSSFVHVCHFNSPSCFYVQLKQDANDIYAIVEKLNDPRAVFSGPVHFSSLSVGDLISAEFPDDGSWYRAVVEKKLDHDNLTVQFIDFGNEATIHCGKTCYLDKDLLAQPRFSVPCTFGAMSNNQEQWAQEAVSAFKTATVEDPEKTYSCTFMKETQSVWDIVLEDQGIVLPLTLIQQTQTHETHEKQVTNGW